MSGTRKRVNRTIAAVGIVATIAVAASACGVNAAADARPEHRSFSLHGKTLTVDSDDSSLELVPTDKDQIEVTRWFSGKVAFGPKPKVTWAWQSQDDTLTLRMQCRGALTNCSLRHRIEVPRDVALVVHTKDGRVRADNFSRPVDIDSRDGAITVTHGTGPLTLRSSDGAVTASDVDARQVSAKTRDGAVRLGLRSRPDKVRAETSDGAITIEVPTAASYDVSAKSRDGRVQVDVPRDDHSDHRLSAQTRDGRVTIRTAG